MTKKKKGKYNLYTGKKWSIETNSEQSQMLNLEDKNLNSLNMLSKLKETIIQRLKGKYDDNDLPNREKDNF